MKHLILIRHGSLDASLDGRYIGSTEAGLSAHGGKELAAIGNFLDDAARRNIYASPRLRVRQSIDAAGVPADGVNWDERLCEISFGLCEKLTYQEICDRYPDILAGWRADNFDFAFPGGEKVSFFRARVRSCLNDLLALDTAAVTVFTHGGVINTILEYLLELPPGDLWRYAPGRGSVSVVRLSDNNRASLQLLNYRPYLFERGIMPWRS